MQEDKSSDARIVFSDILVAEFNYIAQTAFQANEDRARVSTFFLVSLASILAALLTSSSDSIAYQETALVFSIVLSALGAFGILTLMQLARLRAAWFESIRAMNHIKQFAAANCFDGKLETAFLWNDSTVPRKVKLRSVSVLLAIQVLVATTGLVGAAIFQFGVYLGEFWVCASVAGSVMCLLVQVIVLMWAMRN